MCTATKNFTVMDGKEVIHPTAAGRLSLEYFDADDADIDSFSSPGAQVDERSPDPRVYSQQWNTEWWSSKPVHIPKRRLSLPVPANATSSFNLWSTIKELIGKDVTHVSVPVYVCEPLSECQRRAEGIQDAHLLDKAATFPKESRERLLYVTAFAISIYSTIVRTTKPFKDLLHSTYEYVYPEAGYRLLTEKVVHNPSTTVVMCEGPRWRFLAFDETHLEITVQCCVRFRPTGILSVTFDDGDVYEWNQVPIIASGFMVGNIKLDHKGHAQVICKANGDRVKLNISSQGAISRVLRGNNHQVTGELFENGYKVSDISLHGQWDKELYVKHGDGSRQMLWQHVEPSNLDERYKFPPLAVTLNEIHDDDISKLPRTDVRFRPDIRLFEDGFPEEANAIKERLELKQRNIRLAQEANGLPPCKARWFEKIPARKEGELPRWQYKGGYWESRDKGVWLDSYDEIYTLDKSVNSERSTPSSRRVTSVNLSVDATGM